MSDSIYLVDEDDLTSLIDEDDLTLLVDETEAIDNRMNILFTNILPRPNGAWLFTWAPVDGALSYRVILFGRVLNPALASTQYLYNQAIPAEYSTYPPPLEVVTDSDVAVSEIYKPFVILQWYGSQSNIRVAYYAIQQFISGSWRDGNRIPENGSYVYTLTTPVLTDGVTYNFRIVAVGPNGQESCTLPFQIVMVCNPRLVEPSIDISYDDASQSVLVTSVE